MKIWAFGSTDPWVSSYVFFPDGMSYEELGLLFGIFYENH